MNIRIAIVDDQQSDRDALKDDQVSFVLLALRLELRVARNLPGHVLHAAFGLLFCLVRL